VTPEVTGPDNMNKIASGEHAKDNPNIHAGERSTA
jgi:hypothetical protein